MRYRARQSVNPHDQQNVTALDPLEQLAQGRAVTIPAGTGLFDNVIGTGFIERSDLSLQRLPDSRHTRISDYGHGDLLYGSSLAGFGTLFNVLSM
jgi:hypothetical protein